MTTPNPIPTQPETLLPCPFCGVFPVMQSHTQEDEMDEGRYVFFVECGNRQCPMGLVSTGGPFRESAKAAECWNTRRAAVSGPRGDVATTARNRDVAQRVVMSTEGVLGERFDIATRHELADRITAALDAATSSPTPAERESPILAFEKWLTRYVADCGKLSQTEYSIAYAAFIAAHPGEGPLARTMNDLAPARTRVEGEQEDRDPLVDMMMPIIYKAATEPCRNYARGCPANQPDQSFWCAPCEAREAKEIIESDSEIVSRYCPAAPADNDAESSSVVELRSACCNAPTRTTTTDYNVCTACKEACETTTTTKGDH